MAATTTLLGLVTPTQGTISGTWGDTVNYGITDYVDIAIAGTLSFSGDGAITLANTLGSASGNGITSTTAQYMVIRITGTQTVTKVITGPSYSKLYMVDHAGATSAVTFKAAGQTGVTVAVGEKCFVYYNGTDYVKVSSTVNTGVTSFTAGTTGLTPNTATTGAVTLAGTLVVGNGGTGLTSLTAGYIPFGAGTSALGNSANLFFDSANARLGILTTNPQSELHIARLGAAQSATARLQGNQGSDGEVGVLNFSNRTDITGGYIIGSIAVNRSGNDNSGAMLFNTASAASTPSERMRITSAGNVGIGTSSPNNNLEVYGTTNPTIGLTTTSSTLYCYYAMTAGTVGGTLFTFGQSYSAVYPAGCTALANNTYGVILNASNASGVLTFQTNSTERARISAAGGFSVGTTADPGAGAIYATGNITAYYSSDIKFKENVRDIPDALATVNAIGGKLFDWKDDYIESKGGADGYFVQKADFGVVAQDVQKVFPIAVRTREDGSLAVDYEKLGALAFAALVELTKRVEALEAK